MKSRFMKFAVILISLIILLIAFAGSKGELIENLELPVAIGADIERSMGATEFIVPILSYNVEGNKLSTKIYPGRGINLGATREDRQLRSDKKLTLGLCRVYVFSEEIARYGIRNWIDINHNNSFFNDRCLCVVFKGKAEDVMKFNMKGYESSIEFIEGMITHLEEYNFFKMQYTLNDIVVRIDAEGRNLLLPYIEIEKDTIKTSGIAIFQKDKMIGKADVRETKVINMLKENNVNGVVSIQSAPKEYVNIMAKSKRKIKCVKEENKYKFIINLDVKCQVMSNELYKNLNGEGKGINQIEKDLKESIEKSCNEEINQIKGTYKTDVLDLGRVAAAKYGRGKEKDWNEVITNSEIEVKVKTKIISEGRGDY